MLLLLKYIRQEMPQGRSIFIQHFSHLTIIPSITMSAQQSESSQQTGASSGTKSTLQQTREDKETWMWNRFYDLIKMESAATCLAYTILPKQDHFRIQL